MVSPFNVRHPMSMHAVMPQASLYCMQDRSPDPSPLPGLTRETTNGNEQGADLPKEAYPVHNDPSTATQHPADAFPKGGKTGTGDSEERIASAPAQESSSKGKWMRVQQQGWVDERQSLGDSQGRRWLRGASCGCGMRVHARDAMGGVQESVE